MTSFFVIAAVSVLISALIEKYRGLVGLVAILALTTAILVYTKYVSVKFVYDVLSDGYEEPLFAVRQIIGKREVTLCRIALADIVKIERESREERKNHKREAGTALYVYSPTISPDSSYRLTAAMPGERSEIILEGSDEFFGKLLEMVNEARSMRALYRDDE